MNRRFLLWIPLLSLLLAACAPAAPAQPVDPPGGVTEPPTPVPTATLPAAEPVAPTPTFEEPTAAPPEPVVRTGLEATDPTTVQLGAGKPAFVEFFAFW